MRLGTAVVAALLTLAGADLALADMHIRQDTGGRIDAYLHRYATVRKSGQRVIVDGACLSACTVLLGTIPKDRICVTPRASFGFHSAYFDRAYTAGIKLTSYWDTADMLAYYPHAVKEWIDRHGGLTPDVKTMKNGPELWAIVDPCPEEFPK